MTQNQSQLATNIDEARPLHGRNRATTNRSPQQPDHLKRKPRSNIRAALAFVVGFASLISGSARASAQMIVPVDRGMHPPQGFDFIGQWNCGGGVSIAHLDVENRDRPIGGAGFGLSGHWTVIRERQEGFNGNYFVGYYRDKSQFLMIDADDPASVVYSTEGWSGKSIVLTSTITEDQLGLPHRIRYDVNDSHRFSVTWEMLEGTDWKAEPEFTCIKVGSRH